MHSSRCIPPGASLETILAPQAGEGVAFTSGAVFATVGWRGKRGEAMVLALAGPIMIRLTYDGSGDGRTISIPISGPVQRFILPLDVTLLEVSNVQGGANTQGAVWSEHVPLYGPWPGEENNCASP